ncbi:MAG: 5'-3' exonuclease [Polyangiales bacterium]|jgi:5'-3' exonuclease
MLRPVSINVHLIDGTYELFRMYFGAPESKSPEGIEVGACRALLRSLASLLRRPEITHVGIAFDHEIKSFRNDLFDGYKTGEGIEPELLAQFPMAEWLASALGIAVWPMMAFEADDGMAAAAAKCEQYDEVDQIFIRSPDKDMAQCVRGDRVVLLHRKKGEELVIDEDGVIEKWGVPPMSIPDYLALVGDTADGIPGIPRWGAKSTAQVLGHYLSLEAIPDDAKDWDIKVRSAEALAQNLAAERDNAKLYRKLATLRVDAPVHASLEDLKWNGPSADIESVCETLNETVENLRLS